jgi:hypothetical protein
MKKIYLALIIAGFFLPYHYFISFLLTYGPDLPLLI